MSTEACFQGRRGDKWRPSFSHDQVFFEKKTAVVTGEHCLPVDGSKSRVKWKGVLDEYGHGRVVNLLSHRVHERFSAEDDYTNAFQRGKKIFFLIFIFFRTGASGTQLRSTAHLLEIADVV